MMKAICWCLYPLFLKKFTLYCFKYIACRKHSRWTILTYYLKQRRKWKESIKQRRKGKHLYCVCQCGEHWLNINFSLHLLVNQLQTFYDPVWDCSMIFMLILFWASHALIFSFANLFCSFANIMCEVASEIVDFLFLRSLLFNIFVCNFSFCHALLLYFPGT